MTVAWYDYVLGGAAGGLLSKMRKSSSSDPGSTQLQPDKLPGQMATSDLLSNYFQQNLAGYTPGQQYGGQLSVTQPTSNEQYGMDFLSRFLGQGTTDLYGAGKQQLMDTLGGKFADPRQSPYIQAMRALAQQNLGDQITSERGRRGARGTYYTEEGLRAEGELGRRTQTDLNALIGQWLNQERDRQFGAVNPALNYEQYQGVQLPGAQLQAASSPLAALPRLLQQADLERQYQAWLNQRQEQSQIPNQALSYFGTPINYGMQSIPNPPQQSMLQRILGAAAPLAGAAIGTAVAPGVGTAAGYQAGSAFSNLMQPYQQSYQYPLSSSSYYPGYGGY